MKRSPVIARRELMSHFYSPVAYVSLLGFILATGLVFRKDFQPGQVAGMRNVFEWMVYLLVFDIPLLSMGLMSQEWATGTIETLMTAPVEETDVIIGKYLGALSFFFFHIALTIVYVLMLMIYSPALDLGPILSGYLGIILVGSLFIAIGLFCSALTRSQVVAAVSALTILFAI